MKTYVETLKEQLPLGTVRPVAGAKMDIMQRWKQHMHPDERNAFMEDMRILSILTQTQFLVDQMFHGFKDNGLNYLRSCYQNNGLGPWIDWPWHYMKPALTTKKVPVDPTVRIILSRPGNLKAILGTFVDELYEDLKNAPIEVQWDVIQELELEFGRGWGEDEIDGQRT